MGGIGSLSKCRLSEETPFNPTSDTLVPICQENSARFPVQEFPVLLSETEFPSRQIQAKKCSEDVIDVSGIFHERRRLRWLKRCQFG